MSEIDPSRGDSFRAIRSIAFNRGRSATRTRPHRSRRFRSFWIEWISEERLSRNEFQSVAFDAAKPTRAARNLNWHVYLNFPFKCSARLNRSPVATHKPRRAFCLATLRRLSHRPDCSFLFLAQPMSMRAVASGSQESRGIMLMKVELFHRTLPRSSFPLVLTVYGFSVAAHGEPRLKCRHSLGFRGFGSNVGSFPCNCPEVRKQRPCYNRGHQFSRGSPMRFSLYC